MYLNSLINFHLGLIKVWPFWAGEDFASPDNPVKGGEYQDSSNDNTRVVKDLWGLLEVLVKRGGKEEETAGYQKPEA